MTARTVARRRASSAESRWLALSVAYLLLPNLLFALGFLRPWLGAGCAALAVAGAATGWRRLRRSGRVGPLRFRGPRALRSSLLRIGPALLVLTVAVAISGAGGVGHQNADYRAANSLLHDLATRPWPPFYPAAERRDPAAGDYALVYSLAAYLPPAAIGRACGWGAANLAAFVWTWIGLVLAGGGFLLSVDAPRKSPWRLAAATVVFVFASGLDHVGYRLLHGAPADWAAHVEWWSRDFQFSSTATLLLWVPQHAIPAWILTGVVLLHDRRGLPPALLGLAVASTVLWSPFAVLGVAPFLVPTLARRGADDRRRDRPGFANLVAAPAVAVPALAYLLASERSFPIGIVTPDAPTVARFVLFYLLEVAVFLPAAAAMARGAPERRRWLEIAVVSLAILPWIRVGRFGLVGTRATIPALFVLFLLATEALLRIRELSRPRRTLLVAALGLGALTAAGEFGRGLRHFEIGHPWRTRDLPPFSDLEFVDTVAERRGEPDAVFFRWLADPIGARPGAPLGGPPPP